MASAREIQSRMQSIKDTMKITSAMYMISSSKMQKAKKSLADTEPLFLCAAEMQSRVFCSHVPDIRTIFIFRKRISRIRPEKARLPCDHCRQGSGRSLQSQCSEAGIRNSWKTADRTNCLWSVS